MGRPRVVGHHRCRSPDERRESAETCLPADGYAGRVGDQAGKVVLVRSPRDKYRQTTLLRQAFDDLSVALRRVSSRRGARPRMHQDESLQSVSLQETRCSLLVLLTWEEHHLRLDGRETQETCQLQATQRLVFGWHGLLVAVAVGEQGAGTFERSGRAHGDAGQVAQVSGRQRRLLVGGEDYRRVEVALSQGLDGRHLPGRVLWQLEVDVLVRGV